jgi:hypothetical protein
MHVVAFAADHDNVVASPLCKVVGLALNRTMGGCALASGTGTDDSPPPQADNTPQPMTSPTHRKRVIIASPRRLIATVTRPDLRAQPRRIIGNSRRTIESRARSRTSGGTSNRHCSSLLFSVSFIPDPIDETQIARESAAG